MERFLSSEYRSVSELKKLPNSKLFFKVNTFTKARKKFDKIRKLQYSDFEPLKNSLIDQVYVKLVQKIIKIT